MGCGSSTHEPGSPSPAVGGQAGSNGARSDAAPAANGAGGGAKGAHSAGASSAAPASGRRAKDGGGGDGHDKGKKSKGSTEDRFEIIKVLGEGASCKVVSARDRSTHTLLAMKIMDKSEAYNKTLWENETLILKTLRHPNILEWVESYEDKRTYHLLTVLCQGGELFDRVKNGSFSEKVAARLAKDMLQALAYCHSHSIVHRDLKPENFVFSSKEGSENDVMKLIDFGCAKVAADEEVIADVAGSPYYCLAEGTLVAQADGRAVRAEDVQPSMWLVGQDGRRVRVAKVHRLQEPAGVYTVEQRGLKGEDSSYQVTGRHMLTLRMDRNPTVRIDRAANTATLSYTCATHGAHLCGPQQTLCAHLHTRHITRRIESSADASADETEEQEVEVAAASLQQDEQISDVTETLASAAEETILRGSGADVAAALLSTLRSMPRSSYLLRGDLLELSAQDLYARRKEFGMFSAAPLLSGRRVHVPMAVAGASVVNGEWQLAVGGGRFVSAPVVPHARVVYQLFHAHTESEQDAHASSFQQLEPVHAALGVSLSEECGVLVSELHSRAATAQEHEQECVRSMCAALAVESAERIVAFGSYTRERWMAAAAGLQQHGFIQSFKAEEIHGLQSLVIVRASGSAVRVVFAPHPHAWRLTRWTARALSLAHSLPTPVEHADQLVSGLDLDRVPISGLLPPELDAHGLPLAASVVNISIEGSCESDKRYALADGTLTHNCAPEVLAESAVRTGRVWKAADMWSVGVIIFLLVCGYPPFNGDSQERIFKKIKRGKFRFPKSSESDADGGVNLSDSVKGLITDLLQMNPADRLTAENALKHPWVSGDAAPDAPLPSAVVDALGAFRSKMRLKKAVARVLSHHMTEDDRCFGPLVPIRLFNGGFKVARSVSVGDVLIGDDSQPRKVLQVHSGRAEMFEIQSTLKDREAFTCNGRHIFVLRFEQQPSEVRHARGRYSFQQFVLHTETNEVVSESPSFATAADAHAARTVVMASWQPLVWECDVATFLQAGAAVQAAARMFQPSSVQFQPLPHHESLGGRLGSILAREVTNKEVNDVARSLGKWLSGSEETISPHSPLARVLRSYDLHTAQTHLPASLLAESEDVRASLLEGLFNTDREVCSRNHSFIEQCVDLARTLGCTISPISNSQSGWRVRIASAPRGLKSLSSSSPSSSHSFPFTVQSAGIGSFHGFRVSSNGRLLLGDLTVAHNSNLAVVFKKFDVNGDGQLGANELAQMMRHINSANTNADVEAQKIMDAMDEDGDGGVSMDEFAAHVTLGQLGKDKAQIKATFDMFDLDHDGFITHKEIEKVCDFLTPEATQALIKEVDANNDGKINFSEWLSAMTDIDIHRASGHATPAGAGSVRASAKKA